MRRCDVSGPIPKSFGNLKNMVYLLIYIFLKKIIIIIKKKLNIKYINIYI